MKRAQIEALMGAHQGRVRTVVSLHVLRQAALDADDHQFLSEHAQKLDLGDLLRWLPRSEDGAVRGAIVRALSEAAAREPERFRFEALGAGGSLLDEHEWGEVADRTRGQVSAGLWAAIVDRAGGSPTFRALCRAAGWAPQKPLEPAFFPFERPEDEGLAARVARAFERGGVPSLQVAAALFGVRYDEGACRRGLRLRGAEAEAARWVFELERAGQTEAIGVALLPSTTVWVCEEQGDEDAQVRQAYLRHAALAYGGEAGEAWLVEQATAALGRGAPALLLLDELPEGLRGRLPRGLVEGLGRGAEGLALGDALALRALLPGTVDEASLLLRARREAEEDEDDWGPLSSLLPPSLREAALVRARRSRRGPELVALLDWLLGQGHPRRAVVDLAVEALERGVLHRALISWLASQLTTRAAWEERGTEVLRALVGSEALPELNDLLAMAWSQARRERDDDEGEPPEGFRQAVHCAFALALHQAVVEALGQGDRARALLSASALACLDPPPRFVRKLRGPAQAAGGDEVEQLFDVVRSLARHGGGRDASLRDAIAAVHALASLDASAG